MAKDDLTCDVCEGFGVYPIINRRGSELYSIQCPECYGSGTAEEDVKSEENAGLPPASSAAKVKSLDEMKLHVSKYWHHG